MTLIGCPPALPLVFEKALVKESESTLYLPSFTDETAYITTKKANSKVIKSAYETSQRSWFSCSS